MSNKHPSRSRSAQAGFTLVEVVVAMTIFAIGILATTQAAEFGFKASTTNERTVTALNLAREGIEGVRNVRDSNWTVLARDGGNAQFGWDCLPAPTSNILNPPPCDERLTAAGSANYILYPEMGNGYWSARKNTSGTAGTTKHADYQLCLYTGKVPQDGSGNQLPAPYYTPKNALAPCSAEQSFYRRVVISRGKDLGSNQYSAKVTVYVTWEGRKSADIMLEEYLTDWRET